MGLIQIVFPKQVSWYTWDFWGPYPVCIGITMSICVYVKEDGKNLCLSGLLEPSSCVRKGFGYGVPKDVTSLPWHQNTQNLEPQQLGTHIPDKLPYCLLVLRQQVQSHELPTHIWMHISQKIPRMAFLKTGSTVSMLEPTTLVISPKKTRGETGQAIGSEQRLSLHSDSHLDSTRPEKFLSMCVYICVSYL